MGRARQVDRQGRHARGRVIAVAARCVVAVSDLARAPMGVMCHARQRARSVLQRLHPGQAVIGVIQPPPVRIGHRRAPTQRPLVGIVRNLPIAVIIEVRQ